jgi:hypothetical protein
MAVCHECLRVQVGMTMPMVNHWHKLRKGGARVQQARLPRLPAVRHRAGPDCACIVIESAFGIGDQLLLPYRMAWRLSFPPQSCQLLNTRQVLLLLHSV